MGRNSEIARMIRPVLNYISGVGIEFLLAARGTEIIFLPFILAGELCSLFIDGHLTDRINCHILLPQSISLSLRRVYTF